MTKTIEERDRLIEENIDLLYWIQTKMRSRFQAVCKTMLLDENDVDQICTAAFVKAAEKHDPERGRFSTLLYTTAVRRINSEIADRQNDVSAHALSLDYQYSTGRNDDDVAELVSLIADPDTLYDIEDLIESESKKRLLEDLAAVVSSNPRAVKILSMRAQGLTYRDAAKELGISYQRCQQIAAKVKERAEAVRKKHGL